MELETDNKERIIGWFEYIAQIAETKKNLTGLVMSDSDAFDEIKYLAKSCAEYVEKLC